MNYIFNSISEFFSKADSALGQLGLGSLPYFTALSNERDLMSQVNTTVRVCSPPLSWFEVKILILRKTKWPTGSHWAALVFTIENAVLMFLISPCSNGGSKWSFFSIQLTQHSCQLGARGKTVHLLISKLWTWPTAMFRGFEPCVRPQMYIAAHLTLNVWSNPIQLTPYFTIWWNRQNVWFGMKEGS